MFYLTKVRKIFVSILLFIFCFYNIKAQTDTLAHLSVKELHGKIKNHLYSNPNLSEIYAKRFLRLGLKNEKAYNVAVAHYNLGLINQVKGEYSLSINQFNKALNYYTKTNNTQFIIELYLQKGNSYYFLNDNKKALKNYIKAQILVKDVDNIQLEIVILINIALVKKEIGQLEEALQIEKQGLKRSENADFINKSTVAILLMNIGETFLKLKQNDSAIYYNKKGLKKTLELNDVDSNSYFYVNIGLAYINKKEFKYALNYFEKAKNIIIDFNNDKRLMQIHYYIAKCNYELNRYRVALDNLLKAEQIIEEKQYKNTPETLKTYKLLTKIYDQIGKNNKSYEYLKKYIDSDSLIDENKIGTINDLYEEDINNKESEIAIISKKNKKQQRQYTKMFIIGIFIFLIVIFFFIKNVKNSRKNNRLFNELLEEIERRKEKKKSSVNQKIFITDEKTRNVIERLEEMEKEVLFLNPDFSLHDLAKRVEINSTYLSKIINTYKNKRFSEYTNELRINYAIKHLTEDKKFRSYSVQFIAKELGYKSPSSFSKHFKNQTGIFPSVFISKINKKINKI